MVVNIFTEKDKIKLVREEVYSVSELNIFINNEDEREAVMNAIISNFMTEE